MPDAQPPTEKLSAAEAVKANSHFLRGTIVQELAEGGSKFNKDNSALLKFHGTYQQDDREQRVHRDGGKSERQYIFMVRTKIPGGKLTADQLLAELDLCDELATGTLRITSRQGLQLHGVLKHNLKETIRRINEIQLSTLAACGDVEAQRDVLPGAASWRFRPRRNASAGRPVGRPLCAADRRLSRNVAPRRRQRRRTVSGW